MPYKRNAGGSRPGGKKFGGKPPFKGGGYGNRDAGYGGRDSAPQMHEATCAACGKPAMVPFKPNGRKPIFCRDCFQQEDRQPQERVEGAFGKKFNPRFPPKFGPKFEKRSYEAAPRRDDQTEKRFEELNAKLDRIIREIEAMKENNG